MRAHTLVWFIYSEYVSSSYTPSDSRPLLNFWSRVFPFMFDAHIYSRWCRITNPYLQNTQNGFLFVQMHWMIRLDATECTMHTFLF